MPPDPHTGEGLRRPSPDPTPSALWRFALPRLAQAFGPSIVVPRSHFPPYQSYFASGATDALHMPLERCVKNIIRQKRHGELNEFVQNTVGRNSRLVL